MLALPGLSFSLYYLHLIDPPAWYFQFRSLPASELCLIFIALPAGILASWLPKILRTAPALMLIIVVTVPFIKPIFGSIKDDDFKEKWQGKVCQQSTPSTCGAASSATIHSYFGTPASEQEIARDAYSYTGGTEVWYLARALRSRGYHTSFHNHAQLDEHSQLPAIVGVKMGLMGHFIAILSYCNGQLSVADPLRAEQTMTIEQFHQKYHHTGFIMTVSP
ncbi:cysteine peptidase family C39 domain-containing protein [Persicirhabdus sediminis]|uniref:Peptidase C39 domain-containing protein n=1 Tax=Persicirhabdus sediminis TaxID=454144 RepID=A0A8J7SKI2_9BACT|nr:cysteine peptidase family C39 domain-containing protein [Persicirhabdus sediminis]MBK1790795.1 hypothetical protein [Persicirhabdus sediminis]